MHSATLIPGPVAKTRAGASASAATTADVIPAVDLPARNAADDLPCARCGKMAINPVSPEAILNGAAAA